MLAVSSSFQSTLPVLGETGSVRPSEASHSYFNPLSPCWERRVPDPSPDEAAHHFNPFSPCWERPPVRPAWKFPPYFNPLSPCWERHHGHSFALACHLNFNPLSPCWERLCVVPAGRHPGAFQSTLPVLGETRLAVFVFHRDNISIHSPRVGRDGVWELVRAGLDISIHSPRVGRDRINVWEILRMIAFQSTLPVLGETGTKWKRMPENYYFNPLSPCWERLLPKSIDKIYLIFQSTLPVLGETDRVQGQLSFLRFQSTLPVLGETAPLG